MDEKDSLDKAALNPSEESEESIKLGGEELISSLGLRGTREAGAAWRRCAFHFVIASTISLIYQDVTMLRWYWCGFWGGRWRRKL